MTHRRWWDFRWDRRLDLDPAERPRLDDDFEDATEGEEVKRKEKVKSKWAALEAVVGTDKRLSLIAQDLVEHFERRGNVMLAATGHQNASLVDDEGASGCLDTFLGHEAHYDRSNIWLLQGKPVPSRDLHILLGGMNNEFAITAKRSPSDYEYALSRGR